MEDQAPNQPAPRGDRDLSVPLATWLRTQGFTALERAQADFVTVAASWHSPRHDRFELDYTWQRTPAGHAEATCRLRVCYAAEWDFTTLFTAQRVRRLSEARLLLLGNVRYANARTLALVSL
ncbi:MAG: hypothetical protein JWP58_1062 [Hymenobacter sp.]|nr:hypothetical protein [Hymenobacter sp.]